MAERFLTNMGGGGGLTAMQRREAIAFAAYVTGYPVWMSSEAVDRDGRALGGDYFSIHTDWPTSCHSKFWRAFEAAEEEIRERDESLVRGLGRRAERGLD